MSPLPYNLMNSAASSAHDISAKLDPSGFKPLAVCGLAGLVVGGLVVGAFMYYKYIRRYNREISVLQNELYTKEAELDDALQMTPLKNLKAELEEQRDRLIGQLGKVETERDANRRNLQAVEQEIREVTFDRREVWLREKENLLNAQWKLDETKKNNEGQMLFIEKLLETIEIQLMRLNRGKKDV